MTAIEDGHHPGDLLIPIPRLVLPTIAMLREEQAQAKTDCLLDDVPPNEAAITPIPLPPIQPRALDLKVTIAAGVVVQVQVTIIQT